MCDQKSGIAAKDILDGKFIYQDCNHMRVQYSMLNEVKVTKNSEKAHDFTVSPLPDQNLGRFHNENSNTQQHRDNRNGHFNPTGMDHHRGINYGQGINQHQNSNHHQSVSGGRYFNNNRFHQNNNNVSTSLSPPLYVNGSNDNQFNNGSNIPNYGNCNSTSSIPLLPTVPNGSNSASSNNINNTSLKNTDHYNLQQQPLLNHNKSALHHHNNSNTHNTFLMCNKNDNNKSTSNNYFNNHRVSHYMNNHHHNETSQFQNPNNFQSNNNFFVNTNDNNSHVNVSHLNCVNQQLRNQPNNIVQGNPAGGNDGTVILLRNLPFGTTPNAVAALAAVYGNVLRVRIFFKQRSNAVVVFSNSDQANTAKQYLNGLPWGVDGNRLAVESFRGEVPGPRKDDGEKLTKDFYEDTNYRRHNRPHNNRKSSHHHHHDMRPFSPSATIHIANMPSSTTLEQLSTFLSKQLSKSVFGTPFSKCIRLVHDKGHAAVVSLRFIEDAVDAITHLNNVEFEGRPLRLSFGPPPRNLTGSSPSNIKNSNADAQDFDGIALSEDEGNIHQFSMPDQDSKGTLGCGNAELNSSAFTIEKKLETNQNSSFNENQGFEDEKEMLSNSKKKQPSLSSSQSLEKSNYSTFVSTE